MTNPESIKNKTNSNQAKTGADKNITTPVSYWYRKKEHRGQTPDYRYPL